MPAGRFLPTCILFLSSFVKVFPQIVFEPGSWEFENVVQGEIITENVTVRNDSPREVTVSLISTCDCVVIIPDEMVLAPGEASTAAIRFDTRDDTGNVDKTMIVRTTLPDLPKALYRITGNVAAKTAAGDGSEGTNGSVPANSGYAAADGTAIDYFYAPGCSSCLKFLGREIPRLEEELKRSFTVREFNILDPGDYALLEDMLAGLDQVFRKPPVLFYGRNVLQGEDEIMDNITALLQGKSVVIEQPSPGRERLLFFSVVFAGLLDGINPCAFTTLIFLLSSLAVAGKKRRDIFIMGLFYTLSVFITYYAIGLGFFGTLRFARSFRVISLIIKYSLAGVLVVFAVLSFIDFVRAKQGRMKEIILQLPDSFKRRIHTSIRTRVRSSALIGSSIVLGFLITLFELACTGQVYLPTISNMVQVEKRFSGFLMLAVYNAGFILPLAAVFTAVYVGVGSDKITGIFRKNVALIKLFLMFLFILLALLTVLL